VAHQEFLSPKRIEQLFDEEGVIGPGTDRSNLETMFAIPAGIAVHEINPVTTGKIVAGPFPINFE
jgi:hypothetical protein